MEVGDRRYALCFCGDAHKGESDYWKETANIFQDDECIKAVYEYLKSYKYDDHFVVGAIPPRTDAEMLMMEAERPTDDLFLEHLCELNLDETNIRISNDRFYSIYASFCDRASLFKMSKVHLGRCLSRHNDTGKITPYRTRTEGRGYEIHLDVVRASRSKYVKEPKMIDETEIPCFSGAGFVKDDDDVSVRNNRTISPVEYDDDEHIKINLDKHFKPLH
jgi:hypothetical protein